MQSKIFFFLRSILSIMRPDASIRSSIEFVFVNKIRSGHQFTDEDNVESSVINKGGCSDQRRGAGIDPSLNSKGRKPCRVDSRDSAQTYFHVTSIPFIDSDSEFFLSTIMQYLRIMQYNYCAY